MQGRSRKLVVQYVHLPGGSQSYARFEDNFIYGNRSRISKLYLVIPVKNGNRTTWPNLGRFFGWYGKI